MEGGSREVKTHGCAIILYRSSIHFGLVPTGLETHLSARRPLWSNHVTITVDFLDDFLAALAIALLLLFTDILTSSIHFLIVLECGLIWFLMRT
jgi:hypothetical protein